MRTLLSISIVRVSECCANSECSLLPLSSSLPLPPHPLPPSISMAGASSGVPAGPRREDGYTERGVLLPRTALQEPGRIQQHPAR